MPSIDSNPITTLFQSAQKLSVLIVEDDRINNMYLQSLLEQYNFQTHSAYNGLEAIEKINANTFNLILMDGQMPKMDGFETIQKIREEEKISEKHIPIIAISGYALLSDKEKFLNSGADNIVSKPIDENDLIQKIKNLLQ